MNYIQDFPPTTFYVSVQYVDFPCILLYVCLSAGKWCTLLFH